MEPSNRIRTSPQGDTQPAKALALRFISGKYQGGEYILRPNREIIIGRSSELDMVLVEDMVSRKHARVLTHGDEVSIQDLESTNGTFVNGERISKARLNEGDRILIGTSIIRVVAAGSPAPGGVVPYDQVREDDSKRRSSSTKTTMSGAIDEIPVPDLLQLFGTSKKSGVLVVKAGQSIGRIYLEKGFIEWVTIDDNQVMPPTKAMYRILTWDRGVFEMIPRDDKRFPEPMEASIEGLLMEGMRQFDELRRIQPELPPENAPLALSIPLEVPLRALSPEELDILQLMHNHRYIPAVLDASTLTDYDTCEVIHRLVKKGYVHSVW